MEISLFPEHGSLQPWGGSCLHSHPLAALQPLCSPLLPVPAGAMPTLPVPSLLTPRGWEGAGDAQCSPSPGEGSFTSPQELLFAHPSDCGSHFSSPGGEVPFFTPLKSDPTPSKGAPQQCGKCRPTLPV